MVYFAWAICSNGITPTLHAKHSMARRFLFWFLIAFASSANSLIADEKPTFRSILSERCLKCHGTHETKGGLRLDSRAGILKGGEGGKVVESGKPAESRLVKAIHHTGDLKMPDKKIPVEEIAVLEKWIADGLPWSGEELISTPIVSDPRLKHWAFQPISRPALPMGEGKNPIDAFIRQGLKAKNWSPAPPVDRRTYIRRIYFDLVGIAPTYEQIEAFAKDPAKDAEAKLVDQLLASPQYGERWGRHWLDIVRYAETCGYERDQVKPNIWKYRDWVIDAFNKDMPFDQFIRDQLAGDEVPYRDEKSVIATGFLRLGTWNDEPNDPNEYQYDRLEDMIHATGTAFIALTVKCARCHDHKFDPIKQTDYYRMANAFWGGYLQPGSGGSLGGPDSKDLGVDVHGWTDRGRNAPPLKLLKKGDPNRPGAVVEPGNLSTIAILDKPVGPPPANAKTTHRRLQLANWMTDKQNPLTSRVWANRIWQHHFGAGIVRTPDNFGLTGEKPTHPELLDWLATELMNNGWKTKPLHRMILLSDTYKQSSIHPAQAEYTKIDAGNKMWWRAERRRIEAETLRDRLLQASGKLRLNPIGGPSFSPDIPPDALEGLSTKSAAWKPSSPEEQRRRSVYIFSKRGLLPPLLTTFDFPDTTLPSCQRDVTTVAPQALALLNNPFVHQQSKLLAEQIMQKHKTTELQIKMAWMQVLAREPRASELSAAMAHLEAQQKLLQGRPESVTEAMTSLCHVLLNLNEFLYVD